MPRANAQPVRLSAELLELAKRACEVSGRSLPMEIEHRVRESLQRGAWAELEKQEKPEARALGRLVSLLANELETYGDSSDRAQDLKSAVGRLVDRLYGGSKVRSPHGQAEMAAEYWWLRMANAQERSYENGAPSPMTTEQRALLDIRADLPVTKLSGELERSRKERKS
ncbi:MAG: hypothetical protein KGJ78_10690 [Alphaproteobacteria bacterium]|nr:hypothetical protein [Alphaproteobacteria bacterium]